MRKGVHKYKAEQIMHCPLIDKYVTILKTLADENYDYTVAVMNSASVFNVFESELVAITEVHELLYI